MSKIAPSALERKIDKALLNCFKKEGFRRSGNGGCYRWDLNEDRYLYLAAVVYGRSKGIAIQPVGQLGFRHVKEIYARYFSQNYDEAIKIAVQMPIGYSQITGSRPNYLIFDPELKSVESFIPEFVSLMKERFFTLLDSVVEPTTILDYYIRKNERDVHDTGIPIFDGYSSAVNVLIMAAIYTPEKFESLLFRYTPIIDKELSDESKEKLNDLIDYLKLEHLQYKRRNIFQWLWGKTD